MGDFNNSQNSAPSLSLASGNAASSAAPPETFSPEGFVQILARQWRIVAGTAGIVVGCAIVYLLFATKLYTATSKLRVAPLGQQIVSSNASDEDKEGQISADF